MRTPLVIEIRRPRGSVTRDTFIDCPGDAISAHACAVVSEPHSATTRSSSVHAYARTPDLAVPVDHTPVPARATSR
jgi:hypothetical protein